MLRYFSVLLHGSAVVLCSALVAPLFFSREGGGVDIFAAFFAVILMVLGLPWSLLWALAIRFEESFPSSEVLTALFVLVVPVAALLNVLLHYLLLRRHYITKAAEPLRYSQRH